MFRTRKPGMFVVVSSLALGFAAGLAVGQMKPPAENKGLGAEALRSLDLTEEIDSVKGRPLRMRKITLAPEGEVTYHQEGRPDVVVRTGEGFAEGKATTHWAENRGSVPAVWIAVDIPTTP